MISAESTNVYGLVSRKQFRLWKEWAEYIDQWQDFVSSENKCRALKH
jgi:hypothetical protein